MITKLMKQNSKVNSIRRKVLIGLFSLLMAGPLFVAAFGPVTYGNDWRTAPRDSMGIAPPAASHPEAIIQVYSARAFNWRGIFGVHTWISTKAADADHYDVHQVIGWQLFRNLPVVVSKADLPDRSWFGQTPEVIADIRGDRAAKLIPKIREAVASYPYDADYHVWPGPNSNTFTAWVGRHVPELNLQLPATAIGKDYLANGKIIDTAPSGRGYQLSLFGILGLTLAPAEGLEFNLLGLNFGIDFDQTAIILPGVDRLGFSL